MVNLQSYGITLNINRRNVELIENEENDQIIITIHHKNGKPIPLKKGKVHPVLTTSKKWNVTTENCKLKGGSVIHDFKLIISKVKK